MQRISQISARKNGFADDKPWSSAAPKSSQQSSAEINRRRQAEKIAKDNLAMFKRLQSIKPSSDISRQRLDREHQLNRKYMEMHRTGEAPKHWVPPISACRRSEQSGQRPPGCPQSRRRRRPPLPRRNDDARWAWVGFRPTLVVPLVAVLLGDAEEAREALAEGEDHGLLVVRRVVVVDLRVVPLHGPAEQGGVDVPADAERTRASRLSLRRGQGTHGPVDPWEGARATGVTCGRGFRALPGSRCRPRSSPAS